MLTRLLHASQASFGGANAGAMKGMEYTKASFYINLTGDAKSKAAISSKPEGTELVNYWKGKESMLTSVMKQNCPDLTAVQVCLSDGNAGGSGGCASSSGGGGGGSDPCFPSTARVTLVDGTQKQIDQLQEGEPILAATLDGGLAVDTVSLLSIADNTAKNKAFLSITTNANLKLNATSEHHMATGDKCCSQIKKLQELNIGDTVWIRETGKPLPVAQKITGIEIAVAHGLHSPVLTNGGLPIINGFVTSFDTASKVSTAKTWLPGLVSLCKKFGSCGVAKKLFDYSDKEHIVEV